MVFNDIADRSSFVVESTAALDTKIFRHRDLHTLHIMAVPERLHERVAEAEYDHILYRSFAQVMVDPENRRLIELAENNFIQMSCGLQVMAEGLLDDDPGIRCAAAILQFFEHRFEHDRRDREIVRRPLASLQFLAESLEGTEIVIVSIDIAQQGRELLECRGIDSAMFFEAIVSARLELIERPPSFGDADDRHIQMPAFNHSLQGGKDFLVCQVAGRSEENQCVGMGIAHNLSP